MVVTTERLDGGWKVRGRAHATVVVKYRFAV
jgi:hypothetical protein